MDDGALEIEVIGVSPNSVEARVILGGPLKSHKGVNLPRAKLNIPGFTEKDRADLRFGIQSGVDVVAISFVRSANDVHIVRQAILEFSRDVFPQAARTPIIAKIELPEAVENLHEIIHAADGVMVARGDLGIEMSPQSVPNIQKEIIEIANMHSKVVITATQMLDSMIHNPRPTRAESSDVANAIFDGSDAVMLSGETAAGQYPVESVAMMNAIICEAEKHYDRWGHIMQAPDETTGPTNSLSITRAARELAHDRDVAAIAVFTEAGQTALNMSKARPGVPILAFTPDQRTYQRMGLYWGVVPFLIPFASTIESMLAHVEAAIMASTNLAPGQQVVLISGFPVGVIVETKFHHALHRRKHPQITVTQTRGRYVYYPDFHRGARLSSDRHKLGDRGLPVRAAQPERGFRSYQEGRVPVAVYAHLDRDLAGPTTPQTGRHPLPEVETMAERLGNWGNQ